MTKRDWDAELKAIEREMERTSDAAMFPQPKTASTQQRQAVQTQREGTSTWGVFLRLALTVALGAGLVFWPYDSRCGFGLIGYLGAVGALGVSSIWSAVWTFKHRAAKAHILALLLLLWGITLGAMEVLPRIGYSKEVATWTCGP